MQDDQEDKLEGDVSYKFILNNGWSRWLLEMNPKFGSGFADLSSFKKMAFAMKSKDASKWDAFDIVIESTGEKSYKVSLKSLGFRPDGQWHRCVIDLNDVAKSGVASGRPGVAGRAGWAGHQCVSWAISIWSRGIVSRRPRRAIVRIVPGGRARRRWWR